MLVSLFYVYFRSLSTLMHTAYRISQGGEAGRSDAGRHCLEMAALARLLLAVARQRGIDMQIGLHTGKCAGTVLGTLRRFYCVYGDTVNVTARLSAAAPRNSILASAAFKRLMEEWQLTAFKHSFRQYLHNATAPVQCVANGVLDLKGVGGFETYLVQDRANVRGVLGDEEVRKWCKGWKEAARRRNSDAWLDPIQKQRKSEAETAAMKKLDPYSILSRGKTPQMSAHRDCCTEYMYWCYGVYVW